MMPVSPAMDPPPLTVSAVLKISVWSMVPAVNVPQDRPQMVYTPARSAPLPTVSPAMTMTSARLATPPLPF